MRVTLLNEFKRWSKNNHRLQEKIEFSPASPELDNFNVHLNNVEADEKVFMMFSPDTQSVTIYKYSNIYNLLQWYGLDSKGSKFYIERIDNLDVSVSAEDPLTGNIHTRIM